MGRSMQRPSLEEIYINFARDLSRRSTCERLQVGTVITNPAMTQVMGIGYNGNAKRLPNRCDSTVPGLCGCIHSEANALIKAPPGNKMVFASTSPCLMCAKLMINADVIALFYGRVYRDDSGLELLHNYGISVEEMLA